MGRQYPRFLYADPKNPKSEGPFIVHCLEPRIIFKVTINRTKNFELVLLDRIPDPDLEEAYGEVSNAATIWLLHQVKDGLITFL